MQLYDIAPEGLVVSDLLTESEGELSPELEERLDNLLRAGKDKLEAAERVCRNLQAQIDEPVLNGLMGRIAKDEERHEEFFHNLVAHLLEHHREETIEAIARRAAELDVIGADIDAYQDKLKVVAEAGIFDEAILRQVISDRITAWGLADEPQLRSFVSA